MLTAEIQDAIRRAELLPFATATPDGIPNVVPVKYVWVAASDTLWIADNYFDKTLANLRANPQAALYVWSADPKLCVQIKGDITLHNEGTDYEAYLGFGREAAQDLFVEFGPYYRRNQFNANDQTAPTFTVPDDYAAYGIRIFLEHNTVQVDRRTGMARDGFILTVALEREWNNSDAGFGTAVWTSPLPSAVFRGRGRMEWYIPSGTESAFEIFVTGAMADETDRIVNYDATRPQGHIYGDLQLRYRLPLGDWMSVSPFGHLQYVQAVAENGSGGDDEFFLGGGAEAFVHLGENVSLNAWYSYLDNESRPSVSIQKDIHGEHMFYAGMILRLGGSRR